MSEPEEKVRVRLRIEGIVQGVFFRAAAAEEADRRNVKGWVRNSSDGSVEIVAQGRRQDIEGLINWCHAGPPRAIVHRVDIRWEAFRDEFKSFRITR